MANPFGRQAAIVSYRLGAADGVSVTAGQWIRALRKLGMRVRTVAGGGRPDVLVRGLALESRRPPSRRELDRALGDADLVVADNICSLPMNRAVGEAVADYLRGRPAVLRHHDLPWERPRYAHLTSWPPDDPAWWHVTINELARHALAARRGIAATTIYHGFAERPCPRARARRSGDGSRSPTGRWSCSRRGPSRARASTSGSPSPPPSAAPTGSPARPRTATRPSSTRSSRAAACPTGDGCRSACGCPAPTPRATSSRCRRRGRGSGCRWSRPRCTAARSRSARSRWRRSSPGSASAGSTPTIPSRCGPTSPTPTRAGRPQRGGRARPLRHRRARPPPGAAALRRAACAHSRRPLRLPHRLTGDDGGVPLPNRVDPFGALHAVPERGCFTGNRGCLVDDDGRFVRHHRGNLWIICRTAFRGRRVGLTRPRRWTPLFFLDDAVGAGRRAPAVRGVQVRGLPRLPRGRLGGGGHAAEGRRPQPAARPPNAAAPHRHRPPGRRRRARRRAATRPGRPALRVRLLRLARPRSAPGRPDDRAHPADVGRGPAPRLRPAAHTPQLTAPSTGTPSSAPPAGWPAPRAGAPTRRSGPRP